MNMIKYLYDDNEKKCYLYEADEKEITLDSVRNNNNIEISISTKDVKGIHEFFQKILVRKVLDSDFQILKIEFDDIKEKDFFQTEEFQKLNSFLIEQIEAFNKIISSEKLKD